MGEITQFVAMKGVVVREGKILLLRKAKYEGNGGREGRWNNPGGKISPGELWDDALRREISEETGLNDLVIGQPIFVGQWSPIVQGEAVQITCTFLICESRAGEIELSSEHDKYAWIYPHEHTLYDILEPEREVIESYIAAVGRDNRQTITENTTNSSTELLSVNGENGQISLQLACKAIVLSKGKLLMIREAASNKRGTIVGQYHFPGGRMEPGERIEEALKREMLEETSLGISVGMPIYVGEWRPILNGKWHQIVAIYFICRPEGREVGLSGEYDDYQWVDPKAVEDILIAETDLKVIEAFNSLSS